MLRTIAVIGLTPLLLLASPASAAVSAKQKMETCKFGADVQKLEGVKRNAFIKKCMARGNFEPPGRQKTAVKKPMKKPAAAQPAPMPSSNEPPPAK